MRKETIPASPTALVLLLLLCTCLQSQAQKSYSIYSFQTELDTSLTSGSQCTTNVEETIEVQYLQGSFSTFSRKLALKNFEFGNLIGAYDAADGSELGASLTNEVIQGVPVASMKWNYAAVSPVTKKYVLKYSVLNLLKGADAQQASFSWIAAGNDWDVNVYNITTRVRFGTFLATGAVNSSPAYEKIQQSDGSTMMEYFKPMQPSKTQFPPTYTISLTLSLPQPLPACAASGDGLSSTNRIIVIIVCSVVGFFILFCGLVCFCHLRRTLMRRLFMRKIDHREGLRDKTFQKELALGDFAKPSNPTYTVTTKAPSTTVQAPTATATAYVAPTTYYSSASNTNTYTSSNNVTSPPRYTAPTYDYGGSTYDYGGGSDYGGGGGGGDYGGGGGGDYSGGGGAD